MEIERYTVYWVNLDPVVGSEIAKTRPAIVVSDRLMNRHLRTVVVCPLTTTLHPQWRSRIQFTCANRPSEIAVDQIRTISRRRIGKKLGEADDEIASKIRSTIAQMYATP